MSEPLQIVCPHDGAVNRVPAARLADEPRCGRCKEPLFSGRPAELTARDFDVHVNASGIPLLVDFWAPWCGPCLVMAPAFEKAAESLEPHFRLAKVNTETEQALASRFGIRSIPTMILFAGGKEVARQSGALTSPEAIAKWARDQSGNGRPT